MAWCRVWETNFNMMMRVLCMGVMLMNGIELVALVVLGLFVFALIIGVIELVARFWGGFRKKGERRGRLGRWKK